MENKTIKPTVYIESSVISYLVARPGRDVVIAGRQAISHDWWENHRYRFELRISALVEEEISRGDSLASQRRLMLVENIPILAISDDAANLAKKLLAEGAVPDNCKEDALHIGIAAAQGTDYLVTWNFKHINNAEKKSAIYRVVESCGFVCPQICSPDELGGYHND